jgi:hypothetical protein
VTYYDNDDYDDDVDDDKGEKVVCKTKKTKKKKILSLAHTHRIDAIKSQRNKIK